MSHSMLTGARRATRLFLMLLSWSLSSAASADPPFLQPLGLASDPRHDTRVAEEPSEFDYAVEAAFAVDSGSLPGNAFGLELGANLRSHLLSGRLTVLAFPEKHASLSPDDRGAFSLFGGTASACLASHRPHVSRIAVLLCGGLEAGRLHGRGDSLERPVAEGSVWVAPRADATLLFGSRLARGFVRVGGARPLVRQSFQLGGSGVLHQPDALVARASVGVEF